MNLVMWTGTRINSMENGSGPFLNQLSKSVNKAVGDGYKECFKATARGLYAISNSRYYRPEQVKIIHFYRMDAQPDPTDNSILYVLETSDGCKGTLIDAYGHYTDEYLQKFIAQVEDIRKKLSRYDRPEC